MAEMQERTKRYSNNGVAWFLYGCSRLQAQQVMEAARAFGMAHHRNCNLESAALLTFACLKANEAAASDILEQVLATWNEMKRPDVRHSPEDRQVMDALKSQDPEPRELSPLGLLIWRAVDPAHRRRIEALLGSDDPRWAPLRV